MNVAVIGRRHPSPAQIHVLQLYIRRLEANSTIVTGCSHGVDAVALRYAKEKGFRTIGCIPWTDFKKGIQKYCDEIIDLSKMDDALRQKAYESVEQFSLAMRGREMLVQLHARYYLIVSKADRVLAFPSAEDYGETVQGIRLAKALGIPLTVIDENGKEVEVVEKGAIHE